MPQEQKTPEQRELEQRAEELERKIVRFKNIDNERFTHSFRGITISVDAGEEYICRFPEGDHLATHLARKIISREKKAITPHNKGINLFDNRNVAEMKTKIITPLATEGGKESVSAEEARQRDLKGLSEVYAPKPVTFPPVVPIKPAKEVNKKDIIADIKSRGVEPDITKSKEELLEQLMDLEAQGIEPKE